MYNFYYKGNKTKEISFPLGGIGTGSIGLSGNGSLIDWEIFNRPNKGSINGFTHFAIKAEKEGKVLDARVLNSDIKTPYTGIYTKDNFSGFGFGPLRQTMAGVPHFKELEFKGEYPIAEINYIDDSFPGIVKLTAFNPFIPLNDLDSSIPAAFFEFDIQNTTNDKLSYTLCFSINNPLKKGTTVNTYIKENEINRIKLGTTINDTNNIDYGDLTIATSYDNISYQEYWYRGSWFDNLEIFWNEFTKYGHLKNRHYNAPLNDATEDVASLAVHFDLHKGESKKIRFILAWNFPNMHNYWNPEPKCCCSDDCCNDITTWKNYYATIFKDSSETAEYCIKNWDRLYNDTMLFKNTLFDTTLPKEVVDAVSANISILKSPTCMRLTDGSFYGFEGCHCHEGCCEGSCTHVWNYAYALPFLFPKLERSMRDLDYKYNQFKNGAMNFRLQLPLGRDKWNFRPCADGQFGGVIKAYREWKISGDTEWLKTNWDAIKKSIDFAWDETNKDLWDPDKSGVLTGRQHHTLDMELFGPNSWLTGFYLAALKAGAEMARYLGETSKADEYLSIFEKGKKWVEENLYNGEYFYQKINLKDKNLVAKFGAEDVYWNSEAGEIKYQIGEGSGVDQVLAQWHANLCGLGEIFDNTKVKSALNAIYKYNFKKSMRNYFNPCRLFCINDEAGVVICDWPEGKYKPIVPVPYSEETMNGFEYQAACHMIQEGMVEQGLEIVKAIRDRYDGEKRNPWNEFECGSNYARSMASYALLISFSGFIYDMVHKEIGFNPIFLDKNNFKSFWSLDSGWGSFEVNGNNVILKVLYGHLDINKLILPFIIKIDNVKLNNEDIEFSHKDNALHFTNLKLKVNDTLNIYY